MALCSKLGNFLLQWPATEVVDSGLSGGGAVVVSLWERIRGQRS